MTRRVWVGSIVIVLVLLLAVKVSPSARAIVLRSAHAEPAAKLPPGDVIVTAEGKLFHRAGCTFIHGNPLTLAAREAVHRGYTPCLRCVGDLLPH